MDMKRSIFLALIACLMATGCATDVLSTQPEVDIDPEKVDNPDYMPAES